MKWFVRLTVMAALLIFSSVGTAFAEEDMGYIVKLKPTAAIPASFEDGYELDQLKYMPEFCRVETLEELETYIGMENVEYVEPRYPLTLCSQPNDIFYSQSPLHPYPCPGRFGAPAPNPGDRPGYSRHRFR